MSAPITPAEAQQTLSVPKPQGNAKVPACAAGRPLRRRHRSEVWAQRLRERLPRYTPSPRKQGIYQFVVCQHNTQAQAAKVFEISQARVSVIIRHVKDWAAFWGGPDGRYTPVQKARIATMKAISTLEQFTRDLKEAMLEQTQPFSQITTRHEHQAETRVADRKTRRYPPQASFYRLLYQTIMAVARLGGAGDERELLELAERMAAQASALPSPQSQSMVVNAAINVHSPAAAASTPPNGELYSDKLSEPTCVEPPSAAGDPNLPAPASCSAAASGAAAVSASRTGAKSRYKETPDKTSLLPPLIRRPYPPRQ